MKINKYWTTSQHLVAIDDTDTMHFIELKKMSDFLDRNNFLDWHFNITDDLDTAMLRGKLTFEEWLKETERCCMDIVCYLESQNTIRRILDPINNILKNFRK